MAPVQVRPLSALACALWSGALAGSPGDFLAAGGTQNATPGQEKAFEPIGGPDHACRGANASDSIAAYYRAFEGTASLEDCKAHCLSERLCTAIEYWGAQGRCEVWTHPVGTTAEAPGFGCWLHEPAPAFVPADGAVGRACRGETENDTRAAYYGLHEGVTSLYDCQELCLGTTGCRGLEYSDYGRCELWTRSIRATAAKRGFWCLQRKPAQVTPKGFVDQEGATVPVWGEVRLYLVGSSNTPWQTWPDQMHLMLKQMGYLTPAVSTTHPDVVTRPTSAPRCDDEAELSALQTPRIGKVGWSSWGFAFENLDDCTFEHEGQRFRDILGHKVGCTNAWACNANWCCGVGSRPYVKPSDIAKDAQLSTVTVLSNWINDSKQRHAKNVCFAGEAIDPVASTEITVHNLRRIIEQIHARNPWVVVAVLALYPDAHGEQIVERTLPQVAAINAAVRRGLEAWGQPNVIFVNYTLPVGKAVYQTLHSGHCNCRGDKVLASAIIEALFRERVLARGPAMGEASCLAREDCGSLSPECCQRSALCKLDGEGACRSYGSGEQ